MINGSNENEEWRVNRQQSKEEEEEEEEDGRKVDDEKRETEAGGRLGCLNDHCDILSQGLGLKEGRAFLRVKCNWQELVRPGKAGSGV